MSASANPRPAASYRCRADGRRESPLRVWVAGIARTVYNSRCADAEPEDLVVTPTNVAAYSNALVVLGTAGVVVPMVRRWGLSPVLGYLGAGAVLGPLGLGSLAWCRVCFG